MSHGKLRIKWIKKETTERGGEVWEAKGIREPINFQRWWGEVTKRLSSNVTHHSLSIW